MSEAAIIIVPRTDLDTPVLGQFDQALTLEPLDHPLIAASVILLVGIVAGVAWIPLRPYEREASDNTREMHP